ncbi:MAG: RidA family protein [Caldisericaceae bacterium]
MDNIEERIKNLGLNLPEPSKTLGSYVPCVISGNFLFFSGAIPTKDGKVISGQFGEKLTIDDAKEAGVAVVLSFLANIKSSLGSLDFIDQFVKIEGYVSSTSSFYDQPKVLNEVSNLLVEIFGERGKHSRVAIGVCSLPLNAAIEVAGIVKIRR